MLRNTIEKLVRHELWGGGGVTKFHPTASTRKSVYVCSIYDDNQSLVGKQSLPRNFKSVNPEKHTNVMATVQ